MKLLEIHWWDACGADGWIDQAELKKKELSLIVTVGYLVRETDKFYTLTMCDDKDHEVYGAYMLIPKVNIKSKRILK